MKQATVTETKNRLSALLAEVRAGETIVIVDRGIPIARIEAVAPLENDADGRLARLRRAGAVRPARAKASVALASTAPPRPKRGASAAQALIEERRKGR